MEHIDSDTAEVGQGKEQDLEPSTSQNKVAEYGKKLVKEILKW